MNYLYEFAFQFHYISVHKKRILYDLQNMTAFYRTLNSSGSFNMTAWEKELRGLFRLTVPKQWKQIKKHVSRL